MAIITQALVAVGGHATRMRSLRAPVKAFELIGACSALELSLIGMRGAGVRQLVLALDDDSLEEVATTIASRSGFELGLVKVVHDRGLGVTGLPFVAERLLADTFLFDASHSALPTSIYRELIALHQTTGRAVTSAVVPHGTNKSRYALSPQDVQSATLHASATWTVKASPTRCAALPMVLARRHLMKLSATRYNMGEYLKSLADSSQLAILLSGWPPEFDTDEELRQVREAWSGSIDT